MNPHRRVGVMPTSKKKEGDTEAKQPPPPPETDADPVPPEAHFLHIPGTLHCKEGYCAYRARSASQFLLNHNTATAFHPYNWTVLATGVLLLVYGLVVWSKITSHVINVGYALNLATLIYTTYATVLSYYHWDDPPYQVFSPFSFTGVLHSFCGPILLHMTTFCLLIQAIMNIPGVYVHGIHYYPEIALDPTASEHTKVG
ncbi:hypothetical protein CRM22_010967 [Opisthorchis felineus]|uniref:Uncharacterized protein n=1 Tax=Opisthorchis felineus TaxID=147828 RepID=A0A4S2KL68_OPIFE|nr:hypothetical protein CRM22_010967 [Opisthorchis felineus]TGZ48620.1 hypothetical protein CRM22_010967 [Opisthorchis felineus]